MGKYSMVSVGVAVEQESSYQSCANSATNYPLLDSSGASRLHDSNSANITHRQSLRITFAFQAATKTMSDVIITMSDHDQDQLIQNGALTVLEKGALVARSKTNSNIPNGILTGQELQVYSLETAASSCNGDVGKVKSGTVFIEEIPDVETPLPDPKAICDVAPVNKEGNSDEEPEETTKENEVLNTKVVGVSEEKKAEEVKNKEENNNEKRNLTAKEGKRGDENRQKMKNNAPDVKQNNAKVNNGLKSLNKGKSDNKKNGKGKAGETYESENLGKTHVSIGSGESENSKPNARACRRKVKKGKQVTFSPVNSTRNSLTRRARSMSKSRIPIINSYSAAYVPCDYYRQKLLCENGLCDSSTCWLNYPSLQRSAGQKVVTKITAQQKQLEADAAVAQKKKVDFMLDDEDPMQPLQALIPMKKRPSRLEPILVRRK